MAVHLPLIFRTFKAILKEAQDAACSESPESDFDVYEVDLMWDHGNITTASFTDATWLTSFRTATARARRKPAAAAKDAEPVAAAEYVAAAVDGPADAAELDLEAHALVQEWTAQDGMDDH